MYKNFVVETNGLGNRLKLLIFRSTHWPTDSLHDQTHSTDKPHNYLILHVSSCIYIHVPYNIIHTFGPYMHNMYHISLFGFG